MSYQEECEAYALFGNPMQDAMDYELAAAYDRFDGHRMDFNNDNDGYGVLPDTIEELQIVALMNEAQAEERFEHAWVKSIDPPAPF